MKIGGSGACNNSTYSDLAPLFTPGQCTPFFLSIHMRRQYIFRNHDSWQNIGFAVYKYVYCEFRLDLLPKTDPFALGGRGRGDGEAWSIHYTEAIFRGESTRLIERICWARLWLNRSTRKFIYCPDHAMEHARTTNKYVWLLCWAKSIRRWHVRSGQIARQVCSSSARSVYFSISLSSPSVSSQIPFFRQNVIAFAHFRAKMGRKISIDTDVKRAGKNPWIARTISVIRT